MKKSVMLLMLALVFAVCCFSPVCAGKEQAWQEKPVITHIYELSKEKLLVEWDGNSILYQVSVDGKNVSTVNLKYAIIDLKSGSHQINVIPVDIISKEGGNNFSLNLELSGNRESGSSNIQNKILDLIGLSGINGGLNLDIDLAALGIDAKDTLLGNPSDTMKISYIANSVTNAVPVINSAETDPDGRVSLTLTDKYDSDFYRIFIRSGNDVTYADFDLSSDEGKDLITKNNSTVTIILDPDHLKAQECMVPELDQKYGFSVKLQKWPVNLIDGTKETSVVLDSKESKTLDYIPLAAWKNAPEITYAGQTADGQVTLQWEHMDNKTGCEYKVIRQDIFLGVKKGEEEIGSTSEKEFVISDLTDGKYTYIVIPFLGNEEGFSSEAVSAEVKNNWTTAPTLICEAGENNQVVLKWNTAEGMESYHVTVSAGDGSLLRFVNLDYKKIDEFDVPAQTGNMVYTYTCDQPVDSENGLNLKFEIYGIRHAADGSEQKTDVSSQTMTLK